MGCGGRPVVPRGPVCSPPPTRPSTGATRAPRPTVQQPDLDRGKPNHPTTPGRAARVRTSPAVGHLRPKSLTRSSSGADRAGAVRGDRLRPYKSSRSEKHQGRGTLGVPRPCVCVGSHGHLLSGGCSAAPPTGRPCRRPTPAPTIRLSFDLTRNEGRHLTSAGGGHHPGRQTSRVIHARPKGTAPPRNRTVPSGVAASAGVIEPRSGRHHPPADRPSPGGHDHPMPPPTHRRRNSSPGPCGPPVEDALRPLPAGSCRL